MTSTAAVTIKALKVSDLQFNEEYRNMVYSLGSTEYESLKQRISKEGVLIPLEINDKNEILDGNHRAQIAIELGLESIPVIVRNFDTEIQEKIFVIECNLERRQLNDFQKGELYHKLYHYETELEARKRQISNLNVKSVTRDTNSDSNDIDSVTTKGRTREIVAKKIGLSPSTYGRITKIIQVGDELTKEKLRAGRASIGKEYKRISYEEKRQKIRSQSCAIPDLNIDGFEIIHCDFREACSSKIDDNSIDLIFTDPPYDCESLPLYKDLALVAARVLKSIIRIIELDENDKLLF